MSDTTTPTTEHRLAHIGTQNTYVLEQIIAGGEITEQFGDDLAHFLKPMPLLDIDTWVAFALYPDKLHKLISDKNQQVTAFIPHSHNTFGVQLPQNIEGVTPSIMLRDDILLIEPCIRPRSGDLVLICGVVVAIKRRTIDNAGLSARIDPEWNILDTLVLE